MKIRIFLMMVTLLGTAWAAPTPSCPPVEQVRSTLTALLTQESEMFCGQGVIRDDGRSGTACVLGRSITPATQITTAEGIFHLVAAVKGVSSKPQTVAVLQNIIPSLNEPHPFENSDVSCGYYHETGTTTPDITVYAWYRGN